MFGFWRKERSPTLPIYREAVQREPASHADKKPGVGPHAPERPPTAVDEPDVGDELRETDLAALYGLAKTRVLEGGAFLWAPEDRGGTVHMLIKGEITLQDGSGESLMRTVPGNWIGHLDDTVPGAHCCSAVAMKPASVLSLDRETYDGLDRELKLRVLTQIQTHGNALLHALAARNDALNARNRVLLDALYRSRQRLDVDLSRTETVQQIIRKVPRLPVSTATLLGKLFDEHSTNAEVVELVKSDPSLTAALLKAINSPLYGLNHKITHINHAVTLLGFDGVHQLVLAESMRKSLPETPRFQKTHQRAVETSPIAFAAAQATGIRHPAEVSTIALLHEIGTVVLELLKTANPHLEVALATVDSASMGAELLRAWNLPEPLCRSIELQHLPEFALPEHLPENLRKNVALLYLANRLHDRIHGHDDQMQWPFATEYLGVLGVTGMDEWDFFQQKVRPALLARVKTLPNSLVKALSA
jgi:HD-like signal output (HDOD) protein